MRRTELRSLLFLHRVFVDKTRTLSSLLTLFESPEALCLARIDDLVDQGLAVEMAAQVAAGPDHRLRQRIDMDLAWLDEPNHHLLVPHNNLFPPLLREIHDPPPLLFVDGHVELLQGDQFAIVGSRRNSLSGRKVAMQLAADLSRAGLTITSGLALGIDAAAHMGALEAEGCTIAVMGTGCDMDYPATNAALAQRIRKSGVIVSEFPLGTHAFPHYFPRRNRLVTGMSLGTLVVEATLRSGSLISARLALEQGRDVFAVPGPVLGPHSRGCHQLIRDGAKLTETARDILEELPGFEPQEGAIGSTVSLPPQQAMLTSLLGAEPVTVDRLIDATGMDVEVVLSNLVELEVAGYIRLEADGYILAKY